MENGCNMECGTCLSFGWFSHSLRVCVFVSMSVRVFRLEKVLEVFLNDPDPSVTLSLGPDMRKIQCCFSLLKVRLTWVCPCIMLLSLASVLACDFSGFSGWEGSGRVYHQTR